MSRVRKRTLAFALLAAAAGAIVIATRTDAADRRALARISNQGRPVMLDRTEVTRAIHVEHAYVLAVRGGRAVYRVESAGGICLGTGPADDIGELRSIDCPRGPFPTAARPVLDLSVYEVTARGRREVSLYRAEGVVADGVAAIQFLRPDGSVALTVPVKGNVFSEASVPSGPIAGIAALSANGAQVWRSP